VRLISRNLSYRRPLFRLFVRRHLNFYLQARGSDLSLLHIQISHFHVRHVVTLEHNYSVLKLRQIALVRLMSNLWKARQWKTNDAALLDGDVMTKTFWSPLKKAWGILDIEFVACELCLVLGLFKVLSSATCPDLKPSIDVLRRLVDSSLCIRCWPSSQNMSSI
jgi:hypothetical protein